MNKRIVEIAQEVFSFKSKTAPNELNPGHHMDHLHLFAELIIKETLEVARAGIEFGDSMESAVYTYFGVGMSTEDKKTLIKELLGVNKDADMA